MNFSTGEVGYTSWGKDVKMSAVADKLAKDLFTSLQNPSKIIIP